MNNHSVREQALAELPDDSIAQNRQRRRKALDKIRAFPPIGSSLDPVAVIREDRDR